MKGKSLCFGTGLMVAVMATMQGIAQDAAQTPGRGGFMMRGTNNFGRAEAASKVIVGVATNAAVVTELGLTEAQVALLAAGLDAEKVSQALAAQRLAETVAAVLTDAQIATDLKMTPAQKLLIKQKMTADLIHKIFTPQQIDELSREAGAGGMARATMDAMRQRMMQFDKNGDGQLSDEERRAAFQAFGNRRRGGQGGQGGQGAQGQRRQGNAGGAANGNQDRNNGPEL